MNNDAAPSSSARIPDRLSPPGVGANADADDAEADADARHRPESRQRSRSSNGRQRRRRRSKRKQNPGLAKKLAFLTHLLKTLDLVLFAELSSLYYMECVGADTFLSLSHPLLSPLQIHTLSGTHRLTRPPTADVPCFDFSYVPHPNTCISPQKKNHLHF